MKLLAIDTAAEACSAALSIRGEILERFEIQPRRQSELILAMMDELLAKAGIKPKELDAIAYGAGPGSFTGVRIAAGVAQGAAFGCDLSVISVSTLAALAQRQHREQGHTRLLPAFDARMGELYWGCYETNGDGLVAAVAPDRLAPPDGVSWPEGGGWHGAGSGWRTYGDALMERMGPDLVAVAEDLQVSAYDVALLGRAALLKGETVSPEQALPIYLRDEVAKKPAKIS